MSIMLIVLSIQGYSHLSAELSQIQPRVTEQLESVHILEPVDSSLSLLHGSNFSSVLELLSSHLFSLRLLP